MIKLVISNKLIKIIRSKSSSTKQKYRNLITELNTTPFGGKIYERLKGEPLIQEANKRGIIECIPYSVELENRLRLVYEVYRDTEFDGIKYDFVIYVTDIANHEWRGKPYTKQFSE